MAFPLSVLISSPVVLRNINLDYTVTLYYGVIILADSILSTILQTVCAMRGGGGGLLGCYVRCTKFGSIDTFCNRHGCLLD